MKSCASEVSKRKVSYAVARDMFIIVLIVALPWFVIYNTAIHNIFA